MKILPTPGLIGFRLLFIAVACLLSPLVTFGQSGGLFAGDFDFSATRNPNGRWSYGMATNLYGSFTPLPSTAALSRFYFTESETFYVTLNGWCRGGNRQPPCVWHNGGNSYYNDEGNLFLPEDSLVLQPGTNGEFSIIRFRWDQSFSISASLEAYFSTAARSLNNPASLPPYTSEVHVLLNGTCIFDDNITRLQNTSALSTNLVLAPNDVLDFVVGNGGPVGEAYAGSTIVSPQITVLDVAGTAPPLIITQPQPQTYSLLDGTGSVEFDSDVLGTAPLQYQWKFNGADITGATNQLLSMTVNSTAHAGNYQLVVCNAFGCATSSPAALSLITRHDVADNFDDNSRNSDLWLNQNYGAGRLSETNQRLQYLTSGTTKSSDAGVFYWEHAIDSAQNFQLQFDAVLPNMSLSATQQVSLGLSLGPSSPHSENVVVTFNQSAAFHHLQVSTVIDGSQTLYADFPIFATSVSLRVSWDASINSLLIQYLDRSFSTDWQYLADLNPSWNLGDYSSSLAHLPVYFSLFGSSSYRSVGPGVYLDNFSINYPAYEGPPVFTGQSGDKEAYFGATAMFGAVALGSEPISYAWIKDGVLNYWRVANAGSVLTLTNVQYYDAGEYALVASNRYGAVTSQVIRLTVDRVLQGYFIDQSITDAGVEYTAYDVEPDSMFDGNSTIYYNLLDDGAMLINNIRLGQVSRNGNVFVGSGITSDSRPLEIAVKESTSLSTSKVKGDYVMLEFGTWWHTNSSSFIPWTSLRQVTCDGAGNATIRTLADSDNYFVTDKNRYWVYNDGSFSLDSGFSGVVSPDTALFVMTDDDPSDEYKTTSFHVAVKKSSGLSNSRLLGEYIVTSYYAQPPLGEGESLITGAALMSWVMDGRGHFTYTNLYAASEFGGGTYSVASDGSLRLTNNASGTVQILSGAVSGDGSTFILADTDQTEGELSIHIGINKSVPPDTVLQFSKISYTNSEAASATLSVLRTGPTNKAVSVEYYTADDTAGAGRDYLTRSGRISIPPGATSASITIPLVNDTIVRPPRSFRVFLHYPSTGAQIGTKDNAFVCITDNDFGGVINFASVTNAFKENATNARITLLRTGGLASQVFVDLIVEDGTAQAGVDYSNATQRLEWKVNETNKVVLIPLYNNYRDIPTNFSFKLRLCNPSGGATLGTRTNCLVTILDDDSGGIISFNKAAFSMAENGGTVYLTILRTNGLAGDVSVRVATADITARKDIDYVPDDVVLTFTSNATQRTFMIPVRDNAYADGNRTLRACLSNPTGGSKLGSITNAVITILDDEVGLQFSRPCYTNNEGTASAVIGVVRTGPIDRSVSVDYFTSDGTACSTADYGARNGRLTLPSGVNSTNFTITLTNDTLVEGTETLLLGLTNPVNALLGTISNATLYITDNDFGGAISLSRTNFSCSETGTWARITLARTGGKASGVTVDFTCQDGSALAGIHYSNATQTLTWKANETNKTVLVRIYNEGEDEAANREFYVRLSNATGGASLGAMPNGKVVIGDDDSGGILAFSASGYSVKENVTNHLVNITVNRTGGVASNVTVNVSALNVSAVNGIDYSLNDTWLSFDSGVTRATFTISITDNSFAQGNKTFKLLLSNPTGGARLGSTSNALVAIIDDEVGLQFTRAAWTNKEAVTNMTLAIQRTGPTNKAVTVDYFTMDNTAASNLDYRARSGRVSIAAGATSAKISISLLDDKLAEGTESFFVCLTNPAGGAILGTISNTVVYILDNELTNSLAAPLVQMPAASMPPDKIEIRFDSMRVLPEQQLHLNVTSAPGSVLQIQVSPDLASWTEWLMLTNTTGHWQGTAPVKDSKRQFFRAVLVK